MRRWVNLASLVSLAAAITFLSLAPIFSSAAGTGSGIKIFTVGHFLAYFTLAFSASLYLHDLGVENPVFAAIGFSVGFGLLMELVQGQLPYRFFGWADAAYNLIGASLLYLDREGKLRSLVLRTQSRLLETSTFNVRR